jgi:hypothetical protein
MASTEADHVVTVSIAHSTNIKFLETARAKRVEAAKPQGIELGSSCANDGLLEV